MDLSALVLMDPATGDTKVVERDPGEKEDIGNPMFSTGTDASSMACSRCSAVEISLVRQANGWTVCSW